MPSVLFLTLLLRLRICLLNLFRPLTGLLTAKYAKARGYNIRQLPVCSTRGSGGHCAECTDLPIYGGSCRFDLEAVRAAITPETKSILLIDPLNPLGSTYPRDEVRALCELATEHDLWIIDDITYRDFAPEHTLATEFAPERTIIAYSVSKNCGLAGLRVGALVGPQEFIDDIAGHMVSDLGISIVGQRAAIAALETKS